MIRLGFAVAAVAATVFVTTSDAEARGRRRPTEVTVSRPAWLSTPRAEIYGASRAGYVDSVNYGAGAIPTSANLGISGVLPDRFSAGRPMTVDWSRY